MKKKMETILTKVGKLIGGDSKPAKQRSAKPAFTLIEMLVVIGIIAVLIGASIGGYSSMTRAADKSKAQQLVSDVATALTALYQQEGNWPKRLATAGASDGQLDENVALPLAKGKYMSLTTKGSGKDMKLSGHDRFGIVTPWATTVLKRKGSSAQVSDSVSGPATVRDHILHFAIDGDGDGLVTANVGGEMLTIRATAAVWSIGRDGSDNGRPWPYRTGLRRGDLYSWVRAQVQE